MDNSQARSAPIYLKAAFLLLCTIGLTACSAGVERVPTSELANLKQEALLHDDLILQNAKLAESNKALEALITVRREANAELKDQVQELKHHISELQTQLVDIQTPPIQPAPAKLDSRVINNHIKILRSRGTPAFDPTYCNSALNSILALDINPLDEQRLKRAIQIVKTTFEQCNDTDWQPEHTP